MQKKKKKVGMSERERRAGRREKKKILKDHTFFVVFNSFISLLINGMIFEAFFFVLYVNFMIVDEKQFCRWVVWLLAKQIKERKESSKSSSHFTFLLWILRNS
jgi:hypothetical protein